VKIGQIVTLFPLVFVLVMGLVVVIWPVVVHPDPAAYVSDVSQPTPMTQSITTTIFPFGYYGIEVPVENNQFSPRVHIDSSMGPENIANVLNLAEAGGVQVYQYLPAGVLSLPLMDLRDNWVAPAISFSPEVMVGFYPAEEPGESEIPAMVDLLNLVHETDPLGRPVVTYLGYSSISNIRRFMETVDIDLLGAYPTFKGYPQGFMTGVMDSGRQALWPVGKRFYGVPETFGPILEDPDGPMLLRNNVYQAVIGGAEGIIFYNDTGFDGVTYPAFQAELDELREEFVGSGNLGAVVLSPDPPQVVSHSVLSGPVDPIELDMFEFTRKYERMQYHLEVYEGEAYLLATNIGGDALGVEFQNFPSVATNVEVLFEGHSLPLTAGSFQDTFAPYDVHIYKAVVDPAELAPLIKQTYLPILFSTSEPAVVLPCNLSN